MRISLFLFEFINLIKTFDPNNNLLFRFQSIHMNGLLKKTSVHADCNNCNNHDVKTTIYIVNNHMKTTIYIVNKRGHCTLGSNHYPRKSASTHVSTPSEVLRLRRAGDPIVAPPDERLAVHLLRVHRGY